MTAASPRPAGSAARKVQVQRRLVEKARLDRAIIAGQHFLDGISDEVFTPPRALLSAVSESAEVDQHTAQVAFDHLVHTGRMEFRILQGVRPANGASEKLA